MSAETTGHDAANGEDLRARYLPVSRKELRRRREAELAVTEPESPESEAEDVPPPHSESEDLEYPELEPEDEAEDELSRAVEDAGAVEAADLPAPPETEEIGDLPEPAEEEALQDSGQLIDEVPDDTLDEDPDATEIFAPIPAEDTLADQPLPDRPAPEEPTADEDLEATTLIDTSAIEAHLEDDSPEPAAQARDEVPDVALPRPVQPDEPARPEEELARPEEEQLPESEAPTVPDSAEPSADDQLPEEEPDVVLSEEDIALLTAEDDEDEDFFDDAGETDPAEQDEYVDDRSGPVPASRRARRLLKDTAAVPPLDPELLAELDHTTQEIVASDDPERVDPELLKKQQALAAKAMQANQERLRRQQIEQERQARRRRHERPESQVITGKTVRNSLDIDPEDVEYYTGQIEPVHAQGAHGLDLNKLIDATSRQTDRQSMLLWLVIVLAVLLVIAVGVVIYSLAR